MGRTAQLAIAGARVTAVDRSSRRLMRLAANLDRLALPVVTVAADALTWRPTHPVNAVLLDAPCSTTGVPLTGCTIVVPLMLTTSLVAPMAILPTALTNQRSTAY